MNLLYLIGVPGSGKTTLMRELVLGRPRRVIQKPFAHTVYEGGLVQLGRDRGTHGGTDALSMSVQPLVVAALETALWPRVIAEGDRLANMTFFEAVMAAGYDLTVAMLEVPGEVASARREGRGTNQDERWLRGRESKVTNLWAQLGAMQAAGRALPLVTVALDGTKSPQALAQELEPHPVIRA